MTREELLADFIGGITLPNMNSVRDVLSEAEIESIETFDQLRDRLYDAGAFDEEIIYYARAIEYLKEHDPSLQESLGIASEMGFEVSNLNSETLASLLASRNAYEEFDDGRIESEFDDYIAELDDMKFCENCEEEMEDIDDATHCEDCWEDIKDED